MKLLPRLPRPRSRVGRAGMIAGGILGGLVALDLLALAATAIVAATVGLK